MSNEKLRVLIVDDAPDAIHFVMENLKQDYAVLAATNGAKALEIAAQDPLPDVVLMDVEMPDMNGYEVCRLLKGSSDTADIPVIFVSAHDSVEEKLAGYDAGGIDYLIKPVDPTELKNKVKHAINARLLKVSLEADKNMAMQTAMTAMTSAGELGVVLEFLRNSFNADSVAVLVEYMISAMRSYSLECSIQVRSSIKTYNFGSNGEVSPLGIELLDRLQDKGRIIEHGPRLILNFGKVSMLIKNLPLDDSDCCGRIRDNVAILMEGAEAKLEQIESQHREMQMKSGLKQIVANSKEALQGISELHKVQKENSVRVMDELMGDLEGSFFKMGLTEEQEEILLGIARKGLEKMLENQDMGSETDVQLQKIIDDLQPIVKS